jgi:hypothetical protein
MTSSRHRIIAAVLTLVMGVGIGVTVIRFTTTPTQDLASSASACVPADTPYGAQVNQEQEDCVKEFMLEALQENRVASILPAMDDLDSRAPTVCHNAAHAAGVASWANDERWRERIDIASVRNCNSGLLHGVLVAAARDNLTLDQWKALAEWCNPRAGDLANCGDAIGHGAWEATLDEGEAVKICALIETALWRSECSEGVVMQKFEPAGRGNIRREIPTDPVPVCAHVPAGSDAELRTGCVRGVMYLRHQQLGDLSGFGDRATRESVVGGILDTCNAFELAVRPRCEARFFELFRFRFGTDLQAEADRYCPIARHEENITYCRELFAN